MATSRRDLLKQAAILSGLGMMGSFPESVRRAMAIAPTPGTSYLDAKHVVILMQENRSFDHAFGTLRGVRGFDDPRAITLPDGHPVWAQPTKSGKRHIPFRLNIKDTKATWMGSLPHSWTDQVDARNNGRFDRWLEVKRAGDKAFSDIPLTLGYYARADIPFYFALADAFTVCDQNFCSSLTGTTPNRLHLWTGTVRGRQASDAKAHVLNEDVDYGRWVNWITFPERLEQNGIEWKVYQNELSLESGLEGEHDAWLSNFTDNPLEWFSQYAVLSAATHRKFVTQRIEQIPGELTLLMKSMGSANGPARDQLRKKVTELQAMLARYQEEEHNLTDIRAKKVSERKQKLHDRAFTTNAGDPDYRQLAEVVYKDGDIERRVQVPKGDPLHQFRKDVSEGTLPAVSWLVPSERFSDHPGSAWYGSWYVSEVLDILTRNPEIWKKTIFILTYDENDGIFDHAPPFVAPDPARPETGKVSEGIDAGLEFVTLEQDRAWHGDHARESSIGLGYRVPMIIASPWSRGGCVCSEVFDHTSVLQFLEHWLSFRAGVAIQEPNINAWRRAVCGDLTSAFAHADASSPSLTPLKRDAVVAEIHKAQFKGLPQGHDALSDAELTQIRKDPRSVARFPRQEPGVRPACPLPYELHVSGALDASRTTFSMRFEARKELFGERAAGGPFTAYAYTRDHGFVCRNYAVAPGKAVDDSWDLSLFGGGEYHIRVYGPNGYFREFRGTKDESLLTATFVSPTLNIEPENVAVAVTAPGSAAELTLSVTDHSYGNPVQNLTLKAGAPLKVTVPVKSSSGWYDFSIAVGGGSTQLQRRFAGRVESGVWRTSDPLIGRA